MTKAEIMNRILAMPAEIESAELLLIDRQNTLLKAQSELQQVKDGLYIGVWEDEGKKIDGKNAEIRDAQLRKYSTIEQNEVTRANEIVIRQRHAVSCLHNEFTALRAVVDLLKGVA